MFNGAVELIIRPPRSDSYSESRLQLTVCCLLTSSAVTVSHLGLLTDSLTGFRVTTRPPLQ